MKVNKNDFKKALENVKPGLASKEVIEQTTSFAFMGDRVVTYNDEISISHPVEGLEMTGAVKADEMYALLSKLKGDEIEMEIEDNQILITSGKSRAGMVLQAEIKLPLEEIGEKSKWKKLPEDFLENLKFVIGGCSSDSSRPILQCVHFGEGGVYNSSDNLSLTHVVGEELPFSDFLLPQHTCSNLIKFEPTKIAQGEGGWIHFKNSEQTTLSCRLFEEKFPDVSGLLKQKGENIELPKNIEEIIDRAEVFAKRGSYLDESISISITKKKLTVKGTSDTGWFEESEETTYEGDPITFSINPYLFRSILSKTHKCILNEKAIKFEEEGWEYLAMLQIEC